MIARSRLGRDLTAVLRRMPARLVEGQPEGGHANAFEIICSDCGDDPDLEYQDVSPELQRLRGPYRTIAAGAAAYEKHIRLLHHRRRRPPSSLSGRS